MTDYTKIDAAILSEIAGGSTTARYIVAATDVLTRPLWGHDELMYQSGFRTVDRRLQAMKKAGKISFTRASGWILAEVAK